MSFYIHNKHSVKSSFNILIDIFGNLLDHITYQIVMDQFCPFSPLDTEHRRNEKVGRYLTHRDATRGFPKSVNLNSLLDQNFLPVSGWVNLDVFTVPQTIGEFGYSPRLSNKFALKDSLHGPLCIQSLDYEDRFILKGQII